MTSPKLRAVLAGVLVFAMGLYGPVEACGPPPDGPSYIDAFGGQTADLNAFYDGRVGIVMAQSPRAQLFMAWRLLHGLPVGQAAGPALSIPCCNSPDQDTWDQSQTWTTARVTVTGVAALTDTIQTDRPIGNDATVSNCFGPAFANAAATLQDRIKTYGAASPWLKAWVAGQDAVFQGCSKTGVLMPPLDSAAPAWLRADYAYQAAALALYQGDNAGAAEDFAAIGHDASSPWRPMAPYLTARALVRQARATKTPKAFADAHAAIAALTAAPAATFAQSQAPILTMIVNERENPAKVAAALNAQLSGPTLREDAAVDFRDYVDLNDKTAQPPQILDWIATMKAETHGAPKLDPDATGDAIAASQNRVIAYCLAHAQAQWAATHDPAWLIAAMSLASPSDAAAPALVKAAASVPANAPAAVSLAYNTVRLSIASAPQAQTRAVLDAMLARHDLSISDRNLFTAERMQVAESPAAFARLALRPRVCADDTGADGCVRGNFNDEQQPSNIYDAAGKVGLGPDARALIDRLPLADRAALVSDPTLPTTLRLDIALTSWTRAVLMQDNAQIDALALKLETLMPSLAADWTRVVKTAPGPDKRFAEFFIFAQVPGMAPDLESYTRPVGARIADFQGAWYDWMILPAGSTKGNSAPPCLEAYTPDGGCDDTTDTSDATLWAASDVVCLTYCGQGDFPLRRPDFAAAVVNRAALERKAMAQPYSDGDTLGASVWDEVLAYASAHPADTRSPEALYWLVHITRYGHSHDHVSHKAFDILHQRYPNTTWAKETKYYYD
jgi:hypothetical protein